MKSILIHKECISTKFLRYFPKSSVFYYENITEFKQILRKLDNETDLYIIPKNMSNITASTISILPKCKLYYLNQWSLQNKNLHMNDYPSGLLFYVKVMCNYTYISQNIGMNLVVDFDNIFDCDDGYASFFNGYGIKNFDPINSTNMYYYSLDKVPFLFSNTTEGVLKYFDVSKIKDSMRIYYTTIFDLINRTDCVLNYNLSDDWFTIRDDINEECEYQFAPFKKYTTISLHVRSPCHFLGDLKESKFYQSFVDEVENIIETDKLDRNNVMCILYGDSKYSINKVKDLLTNNKLNYHVFNESRSDLSETNVDWCVELKPSFDRYIGTIKDTCLMSKSDYIIGGKSNVIMYIINYNKNIKLRIPKPLLVDVY